MKKIILATLCAFSLNASAQIEPTVTYNGGDLYFVPSQLTSKGVAFMYSHETGYDESHKTWFTVFDDKLNIVKQAEIDPEVLNYKTRTVTYQRRYLLKQGGGTRAASSGDGYFLDEWKMISDITEDKSEMNYWTQGAEVYEDNNSYHSRYMYLSQTLFNDDEDFEFLRLHYDVMPLTYCAAEDTTEHMMSVSPIVIGGEECDECSYEYDNELGGLVYTMKRYKVYGGLKNTGLDVVSLDGKIKKTIEGITEFRTVVAINGNYYVSGYDYKSSKYALYKIATASSSLSKVAEISGETKGDATYNLAGVRVKPNTKGLVIRNNKKFINE